MTLWSKEGKGWVVAVAGGLAMLCLAYSGLILARQAPANEAYLALLEVVAPLPEPIEVQIGPPGRDLSDGAWAGIVSAIGLVAGALAVLVGIRQRFRGNTSSSTASGVVLGAMAIIWYLRQVTQLVQGAV